MDGSHFDTLVKTRTTTALSRGSVLRGLAASAAALVGTRLTLDPGAAKKKNEKERKVCVCGADGTVGSCHTKKVKADNVKKLLRRNRCASKGKCTGVNPCATQTPAPTCSDGSKNGRETGVDCGGPDCPPCANGQGCRGPVDCMSAYCISGVCRACPDGVPCGVDKNGTCNCSLEGTCHTTLSTSPIPGGSCPEDCPLHWECIPTQSGPVCFAPCGST